MMQRTSLLRSINENCTPFGIARGGLAIGLVKGMGVLDGKGLAGLIDGDWSFSGSEGSEALQCPLQRTCGIFRYEAARGFQFARVHSSFFSFGLERLDQIVEIDRHWGSPVTRK